MSYKLQIDPAAARELRKLSPDVIKDLATRIHELSENPRPAGCKLLADSVVRGWRIRAGKYRVLYLIDDTSETVSVYEIGLRDRVYKKR